MIATCIGFGGSQVKPSYEPRLAAASARPGARGIGVRGSLRLAIAY